MRNRPMRRRPSQLKLQQIGDVLQRILGKHRINIHHEDKGLSVMWSKAAGAIVATQTKPEKLVRNVLTVKVKNSVWLHQLQFLKPEILDKINSSRQENPVEQIRFILDTNPSQGTGGE